MRRTITEGNTQNSVHSKYKEIKAINSHKDCSVLVISTIKLFLMLPFELNMTN